MLDPTDARADATQAVYALLQAGLDQLRLLGLRAALATGQAPQLAGAPADASPDQIQATQATMFSQYAGQVAKLADLDQQTAQQQEKNTEALASLAELQASLTYAQQMAGLRNRAMTLGVGSQIDAITASG